MQTKTITANLGDFDKPSNADVVITDKEFPPRINSMTPRLQARIVKMFMWQFVQSNYYIWVDSSCHIEDGAKEWFLDKLGEADIAVFKHPNRDTVQQEADYLKHRLAIDCPYITPRYANEDIDGQLKEVDPTDPLYASTAFIYKLSDQVKSAMYEWWYHTSRYHSIDQLSFPWAIRNLNVNLITDKYDHNPALNYTRNKI